MKQIAIFYRDRENLPAIKYIENNFYGVLGDFVHITNYYLNEIASDQIIDADAYIVCYEEMLGGLMPHITDFSNVIVIKRSFQQKYLRPISEIPAGTDVLVVNDSRESILQTMYMIYELGIGHIRLIPYDKDTARRGGYESINTAVVANYSESLVPPHIKNVYNIRNREISFETFHKLISLLGLENSSIQVKLLKRIRDNMNTDADYIGSYLGSFLKDAMFANVVDQSSRGIILLDSASVVHYVNEKAYSIFHVNQGDFLNVKELFSDELCEASSFHDEIVTIYDTNYLAEKLNIELINQSIGSCIILQNEKDLRETENSLSRQLKDAGFRAKYSFSDIKHQSDSIKACISISKKIADSDYTVLIRGESGTGKELFAQSIHNYSVRKNYPFVAVNCAAIPETLLESELFGYEKGSFTGASRGGKIGLFERARHGTIFLDEIGDISAGLQTRLLRVIQEREIMRIGSDKIISIDARIIAATNADLEEKVAQGKFRSDLFYRLNVISLDIEPLRERKEDIDPLLHHFLGKQFNDLSPAERAILHDYSWPGNIRELENFASYYRALGSLPSYIYKAASRPDPSSASGSQSSPQQTMSRASASSDTAAVSGSTAVSDTAAASGPATAKSPLPREKITERELQDTILNIIAENSSDFSGIGRMSISAALSRSNIHIGEGILKKQLAQLKSEGLIESGHGRGGSRITASGLVRVSSKA